MGPAEVPEQHAIHVGPTAGDYDILIAPGMLDEFAGLVLQKRPAKAGLITDSQVGPLHARAVKTTLRAVGIEPIVVTVPAGEQYKSIETIQTIYDTLLSAGMERSTPVIGLGGGVITDMAGFVAATVLRGVPLIQIPTSLLAMVDASVGGKTGVNHTVGKNLIGAFHQPSAVVIDPDVLTTLPERELRGGLAECIKHDIIRDASGFDRLEANIDRALKLDIHFLGELVAHNVAIKARVVEADPFEKGERAHLNFGHTFGHAIETVSRYAYSHGESVALGMVAAARLATDLGMLDEPSRRRIVDLIARAGLPTGGMSLPSLEVFEAMRFDKKVREGKLRLVLPERIGYVVIRDDVAPNAVAAAIDSLAG